MAIERPGALDPAFAEKTPALSEKENESGNKTLTLEEEFCERYNRALNTLRQNAVVRDQVLKTYNIEPRPYSPGTRDPNELLHIQKSLQPTLIGVKGKKAKELKRRSSSKSLKTHVELKKKKSQVRESRNRKASFTRAKSVTSQKSFKSEGKRSYVEKVCKKPEVSEKLRQAILGPKGSLKKGPNSSRSKSMRKRSRSKQSIKMTNVKKTTTPSRLSRSQTSSRKQRPVLEPHLNARYTRKKAELIYSYPIRLAKHL